MLGRLNRIKGQDLLIEALALLPKDIAARLDVRIVGDTFESDAAREQSLHGAVRDAGLADIVRFEPFQADPAPLYRWADVVAVPSRMPEALGRVAIEAMAHRRPPLVARIGGLAEVVEDGATGWIVAPNDARALADMLAQIVTRPADWRGYDEGMIVYVLGLGSPTHPIDPAGWTEWTNTYKWADFYGQTHVNFAPLFGHQYSHIWIDFRGIRDAYMRGKGIDYFENSRRATLSQRSYAISNPGQWKDYGANVWGLTAGDGPFDTTFVIGGRSRQFFTYRARGAAADEIQDDGTIAPTAAGGSIAFAPDIAVPALVAMREKYGDNLFSAYGFLDDFNPTLVTGTSKYGRIVPGVGWFDTDYLGIDQGPIVAMIENYRSDLIWKTMRKNPYIVAGLKKAGFTGGWLGD